MMISRLPRLTVPYVAVPSISETTAGLDGFLASNNSVTRGKPPVISPVLPAERGILTRMSPASILSPSATEMCALTGIEYSRSTSLVLGSMMWIAGDFFLSRDSMITFSVKPVCSSTSSRKVMFSMIPSKTTLPATSPMMRALYGSHLQITSPFLILVLFLTMRSDP